MVRLQVREKDGRITERPFPQFDRVHTEWNAKAISAAHNTETWVVNYDGSNCVHFIRGVRAEQ